MRLRGLTGRGSAPRWTCSSCWSWAGPRTETGFIFFARPGAPRAILPPMSRPRVLVVDDEPRILEIVKYFLEQGGFDVEAFTGGATPRNVALASTGAKATASGT